MVDMNGTSSWKLMGSMNQEMVKHFTCRAPSSANPRYLGAPGTWDTSGRATGHQES